MRFLSAIVFFSVFFLAQNVCSAPIVGATGSVSSRNLRALDNTALFFEYCQLPIFVSFPIIRTVHN